MFQLAGRRAQWGDRMKIRESYKAEWGVPMKRCHRCGGVMVLEKFYGLCEQFSGWRCVLCGEIVDQVILGNRLEQKQ